MAFGTVQFGQHFLSYDTYYVNGSNSPSNREKNNDKAKKYYEMAIEKENYCRLRDLYNIYKSEGNEVEESKYEKMINDYL